MITLSARIPSDGAGESHTWWSSRPPEPRPGPRFTAATVAALAAYAVAAGTVLDAAGQLVAGVLLVFGLTLVVRRAGVGPAELGLAKLGVGLRWGLAVGLPVAVLILLLSFVPLPGDPFVAERYGQMDTWEVVFRAAFRIPLGTALFEEYLFRGVLVALLLRQVAPAQALALSSLLFGAWHVFPALGDVGDGGLWRDGSVIVPVTFVVTGAAGALLAWLRIRSGSLLAPFLVHALVNSTALVGAQLATNRGGAA